MEQIIRKMNLSIITCMLVLILSVTTTYAWAGLQNYSNIENIDFNLESSETYAIQVSLDGISFFDEIKEIDLKETILRNMGIITEEEVSDSEINSLMENVILDPLSTKRVDNELGAFVSIDDIRRKDFNYDTHVETKKVREAYFNFDIYVSLKYIGEYEDDFYLKSFQELYVSNLSELLMGNDKTYKLKSNHILENYFKDITLSTVTVNSSSAARISFTKYEVMDKSNPVINDSTETIIYQGGTSTPTLNDDVYCFGGFMSSKDNLAYMDFNSIHYTKQISEEVFNEFYKNRTDESGLEDALSIDQLNDNKFKLISAEDGFNTTKMMKINVKMWLEGFDADCFEVVSSMPIGFKLVLSHYGLH